MYDVSPIIHGLHQLRQELASHKIHVLFLDEEAFKTHGACVYDRDDCENLVCKYFRHLYPHASKNPQYEPIIYFSYRDLATATRTGSVALSHALIARNPDVLAKVNQRLRSVFPTQTAGILAPRKKLRISVTKPPHLDRETDEVSCRVVLRDPPRGRYRPRRGQWLDAAARAFNGTLAEYEYMAHDDGDGKGDVLRISIELPVGKRLRRIKWFRGVRIEYLNVEIVKND